MQEWGGAFRLCTQPGGGKVRQNVNFLLTFSLSFPPIDSDTELQKIAWRQILEIRTQKWI